MNQSYMDIVEDNKEAVVLTTEEELSMGLESLMQEYDSINVASDDIDAAVLLFQEVKDADELAAFNMGGESATVKEYLADNTLMVLAGFENRAVDLGVIDEVEFINQTELNSEEIIKMGGERRKNLLDKIYIFVLNALTTIKNAFKKAFLSASTWMTGIGVNLMSLSEDIDAMDIDSTFKIETGNKILKEFSIYNDSPAVDEIGHRVRINAKVKAKGVLKGVLTASDLVKNSYEILTTPALENLIKEYRTDKQEAKAKAKKEANAYLTRFVKVFGKYSGDKTAKVKHARGSEIFKQLDKDFYTVNAVFTTKDVNLWAITRKDKRKKNDQKGVYTISYATMNYEQPANTLAGVSTLEELKSVMSHVIKNENDYNLKDVISAVFQSINDAEKLVNEERAMSTGNADKFKDISTLVSFYSRTSTATVKAMAKNKLVVYKGLRAVLNGAE